MSDYLFLFSNAPENALICRVQTAIDAGRKPLVIYLQRSMVGLLPEIPTGCDVLVYPVPFANTEWRRAINWIQMVFWLRRVILERVVRGCDCYCTGLDMLAMAMAAGVGRTMRYRYEVADLHRFQLGAGAFPAFVRRLERLLVRRLHVLVLSSTGYWERYYRYFPCKAYCVVENVPPADIWVDFSRPLCARTFTIGFVGIIRYLDCLEALVRAVRILRRENQAVRILFAGGGCVEALSGYCDGDDFVSFTGPFRYAEGIRGIYGQIDLIYSVYDTKIENVRHAMPNKFYEALITRTPIMVASGTYLERRVKDAGIGIGVPCTNEHAIASALRAATADKDWFRAAKGVLAGNLAESYFQENVRAQTEAVLGTGDALRSNNCDDNFNRY
jgi:glycosyltransferase involved in cell wall biosynthesis